MVFLFAGEGGLQWHGGQACGVDIYYMDILYVWNKFKWVFPHSKSCQMCDTKSLFLVWFCIFTTGFSSKAISTDLLQLLRSIILKTLTGLNGNSQGLRSAANCTQATGLGELFGCPAGGAAVPPVGAGDHSPLQLLQVCSLLQDSHVLHSLCFCRLLVLCCVRWKSSSSVGRKPCCMSYAGRAVLKLCVLLQSIQHFPDQVEKCVKSE